MRTKQGTFNTLASLTKETSAEHATSLVITSSLEGEVITVSYAHKKLHVQLRTAFVKVKTNDLETECRVIMDTGSQVNLITERLVARLILLARTTFISIDGIEKN